MLGEFLYGLTAKDAATQPVLQRRTFYQTASAAAAAFNLSDFTVPNDKALWLNSLTLTGVGGGAQTVTAASFEIRDTTAANAVMLLLARFTGTAANTREFNLTGLEHLIMPNERVWATITFSAGAIANTYEFSGHGIMIPRGNLQLR